MRTFHKLQNVTWIYFKEPEKQRDFSLSITTHDAVFDIMKYHIHIYSNN